MKLDLLRLGCPACGERGVGIFADPAHCAVCGKHADRQPAWGFFWRYVLFPGIIPWLMIGLALCALVDPLSWAFATMAVVLILPFLVDRFIPLRPIEAPTRGAYTGRQRMFQYLLIALPFLQLILPFVGHENYEVNLPLALVLAAIAAAVIVHCAVLNGRYFFYRARRSSRPLASFPELPKLTITFTLVIPVLWTWLSLIIFYCQVRRFDSSPSEIALISLGAAVALVASLWGCHWAGKRRRHVDLQPQ